MLDSKLFGVEVKDKITGFKGVITGITEYLTGCQQVLVQAPVDDTGKWVEAHWFDVDRLEHTGSKIDVSSIHNPAETKNETVLDDPPKSRAGFDMPAPIR